MGQPFRVGKPWLLLTTTSPKTQASGLHAIDWDVAVGDGDIEWPGATNGEVNITLAGLYLVVLNVGRDAVATSSEATGRILVSGFIRAGARSPASTTAVFFGTTHVRQLVVGDVVTTACQLSSVATAGFDENATSLSLTRIGPVAWR